MWADAMEDAGIQDHDGRCGRQGALWTRRDADDLIGVSEAHHVLENFGSAGVTSVRLARCRHRRDDCMLDRSWA
jgi:hypothetical protein